MKEHSESSKDEQKHLLIEMMKEDEKNGMYEKSDNEIIAEFMGFTCCDTGMDRFWNPPTDPPATVHHWKYHSNHLDDFQTSWDWLHPVVEKIKTIQPSAFKIDLFTGPLSPLAKLYIHSPIEDVHKAVVGFIKFYNSQQYERK